MLSKRKKTGLLKSKHAGVAVEFALIAPILFLFVLGIVDFGRAVILSAKLSSAARAGAQYAIIVSIEEDAVENAVRNSADFDDVDSLGVSVSEVCECSYGVSVACDGDCGGDSPHKFVSVAVDYPHDLFFSYPGVNNPMTITKSATMRME